MCSDKEFKEIKANGNNIVEEAEQEIKDGEEKLRALNKQTEERLRSLLF